MRSREKDEFRFVETFGMGKDLSEILKLRLWKQYEHNRDAYTDAKTNFIFKWTAEARKEYGDRY